jgi:glycosyltransferase involved in cell wall biosynthesis
MRAGGRAGLPYSFTAHATDIYRDSVDVPALVERMAGASFVVTVSDANRRHLEALLDDAGRSGRVVRLYNGLDLERVRPFAGERAPRRVVAVGRLIEKKGFADLVEATRLLAARGEELRTVIVGDGPERASLEALARELRLGDALETHGFVPNSDLPSVVGDAWVQVVPSVWEEPFGMVTIEAMMRGMAVIASNTGGPSDVVRHGETGLLVPPGNDRALAAAIVTLLRDRDLAERMGARGYEIARTDFTEEAMMDRVTRMYERARERFLAARA